MKNKLPLLLITLIISVAAGYFGRGIPLSEQVTRYDSLLAVSSIVIAVVGIWVAIIYPEQLKVSKSLNTQDSENYDRFIELLMPIIYSTTILLILLLLGVIIPILKQTSFFDNYPLLFQGFSYGTITLLTIFQAYSLVLTFLPIDTIMTLYRHKKKKENTKQAMVKHYKHINKNKQ